MTMRLDGAFRWLLACGCAVFAAPAATPAAEPPNLLLITTDDMSCDSVGAFGCGLEGTTPNMDRLAATGMRFEYAHVQCGNCMPSRNVMWSGRYPHNNRVEGFYQVKDPDYPVLVDLMKQAGYFTAIRGKVAHSTPYHPYAWDLDLDAGPDNAKHHPKHAASYRISASQGIQAAQAAGKPFCLVINIADPHKPFYAEGKGGETVPDAHVPTRVFEPDQVPVPGFLFDDPVVRKELSHYYSSVRRADDCLGEILAALEAAGQVERTLVMFLSDHGMPLPFAKTQVYHHSTRTPLIVRWPGRVQAGSIDARQMVSAVDFLPTLLDVVGADHPAGLDGSSFAPLLRGEPQAGRDFVIKEYNENAGGSRDPMRAVQTRTHLYIFNAWSNGERVMASATTGTPTYRRMAELARSDPRLAARLDLYQHRVVEELYDVANDPDCLRNLIHDPGQHATADELRRILEQWMVQSGDPLLDVFQRRGDAEVREAFMQRVEREAEQRRGASQGAAKKTGKKAAKGKRVGAPAATAD